MNFKSGNFINYITRKFCTKFLIFSVQQLHVWPDRDVSLFAYFFPLFVNLSWLATHIIEGLNRNFGISVIS